MTLYLRCHQLALVRIRATVTDTKHFANTLHSPRPYLFENINMESWEGYNYYTTNSTRWVELMNYSTIEFGLGYFPPNIIALPGALNSSYNFSNDTFVIEYAGRADSDNRATEKIVFGVVSAIAIAFAAVWVWFNRKTLFHPRNSHNEDLLPRANSPTSNYTAATELTPLQDSKFWGANDFKNQIFNFYYEPVHTEVELFEKTIDDKVDTDDIEAVTDLVREGYRLELLRFGLRESQNVTEERQNKMISEEDALQEEAGRRIEEWESTAVRENWTGVEYSVLNDLVRLVGRPAPGSPFPEQ
ncbi:hypothetical protein HD806DRAFT_507126 [Xylariaceae sp. AK1471]|nr:hypothetical protein HD806DRAFT_507126 [Xylariaceae sp. AK1471]